MIRQLRLLALIVLLAINATPTHAAHRRPLTILISIDGFRADYLAHGVTPNMSDLAATGVKGSMRPSFPSKTFPNHYALVTGLRPDRNGVVENTMLDPAIPGVTFRLSDPKALADPRWWEQATPIWVTAQRAGLQTATMFWPGSDVEIQGVRPTHWRLYDMKVPAADRADQVLAWLDERNGRQLRFMTLYFDDVDTAGHDFGPASPELDRAASVVDSAIGRLVAGLKSRGIPANIVVVADHGMAATPAEQTIYFDDLVPTDHVKVMTSGAYLSLYPVPGHEGEIDAVLPGAHGHMQCWRKAEIPAQFHYGANPRVAPYFCLAETGWSITSHKRKPGAHEAGNHGFDPAAPEMAAVFIASGPGFRRGATLPAFDNVDVYPLVARLVGVRPVRGDGRLADIASALVR